MKTKGLEVQGHPGLYKEFEAILQYIGTHLNKNPPVAMRDDILLQSQQLGGRASPGYIGNLRQAWITKQEGLKNNNTENKTSSLEL